MLPHPDAVDTVALRPTFHGPKPDWRDVKMGGFRSRTKRSLTLSIAALLLGLGGCGDGGTGVVLDDLVLTTATTGLDVDPDGYLVVVEGLGTRPIAPTGTVAFEDVPHGPYTVELTGVAANCTVTGQNPRTVTSGSPQAVAGRFEVTCVANVGTVEVLTVTSGVDVDSDGYDVVVDDVVVGAIGVNHAVTFTDIAAGDRMVEFRDVAPNCAVVGENPRSVSVPLGGQASMTFEVECHPNEGVVQVVTVTTGEEVDPEGYMIAVDDVNAQAVAVNDTVTLAPIPAGPHQVLLSDVAANCVVNGDNPRTVNVLFGDTVATTFEVTCQPEGDLEVGLEGTGMNIPAGLTAVVNGSWSQEVGLDGSTLFESLPSGDHVVELTDLPSHCEIVNGPNPRTVTIASGVGDTTFGLQCSAWLVFDSDRDGNGSNRDVIIMRHDGADQTNLTNSPSTNDRQPVVSPDRSQIAFVSDRNGSDQIYLMNADGSNVVQLTNATRATAPYWSPDGTKIAFSGLVSSQWDTWVINPDGSGLLNLTNHPAQDRRAEWSRDGTKLVFDSDRAGSRDIYVMNPDGSGVTRVTTQGGANPTWSPDGTRIAFTFSNPGAESDVWVVDADGSNRTNLTNVSGAEDGEATWSHDGSTIAFATNRDGHFEIYLMNPDGTNLRRLTSISAADKWPSWSP